jgi:hypothetical protein
VDLGTLAGVPRKSQKNYGANLANPLHTGGENLCEERELLLLLRVATLNRMAANRREPSKGAGIHEAGPVEAVTEEDLGCGLQSHEIIT